MVWICSLIYLIIFLWGRVLWGRFLNLLCVFGGFYFVIITMANLQLSGYDEANDSACIVMILGGLLFALGYTAMTAFSQSRFRNRFRPAPPPDRDGLSCDTYGVRKGFFILMLIIVLAYAVYRVYILFTLLRMGYSYDRIRTIYFNSQYMFSEDVADRYGRNQLDIYFVQPLQLGAIFIASINFFSNQVLGFSRKGSIWCLALSFLSVLLTSIANGGRESFFYASVILFFTYASFRRINPRKEKKRMTGKQKRFLRIAVVAALVAFAVITFNRSSSATNSIGQLFSTLYNYFTGFFVHLGIRLNRLSESSRANGYAFILGLIKLPAAFLHRVLRVSASDSFRFAEALTSSLQNRVTIGEGKTFNAYVGPFYYFFCDFGYPSLIIESFLFGAFCANREWSFCVRRSAISMFMYLFCFFLIISSMVRWEMVHPRTAMLLYFVPIIFRRRKQSESVLMRRELYGSTIE